MQLVVQNILERLSTEMKRVFSLQYVHTYAAHCVAFDLKTRNNRILNTLAKEITIT